MPLFVIATPIGNLEDITFRAVRTLKEADIILAEDTRVAAKLLAHLGITGKIVLRYDEHSHARMLERVQDGLKAGRNIALTTDAGTPGISDPGARLVAALRQTYRQVCRFVPIPGPSAVTTLLSVSGFKADSYFFAGFPPHKKGRTGFFESLATHNETVVFFESVHRILKTLDDLARVYHSDRCICVGRELTKVHETIHVGTLAEVTAAITSDTLKGEFVIAISPR